MSHENCIFCKIIKGEIPSHKIYEDEEFQVILDVSPAAKGHALLLPKQHYADIYDMDAQLLGNAAKTAQKVIQHAAKVLDCDGYNLVQNNGEAAGQTVFHFHMHLIPRYKDMENENFLTWKAGTADSEEMKALCEQLKVE